MPEFFNSFWGFLSSSQEVAFGGLTTAGISLTFAPLVSWLWILGLGLLAVSALLLSLALSAKGSALRFLTFTAILLVLANPSMLQEEREALKDVVIVLVDESSSLAIGQRQSQIDKLEDTLSEQLATLENKDVRVLRFSDKLSAGSASSNDVASSVGASKGGTRFKKALDTALSEAPLNRLAAVIVLSDGQLHDLPEVGEGEAAAAADLGLPEHTPLHHIVVGQTTEVDRVFRVNAAPKFGLVGEKVEAKVLVTDLGVDTSQRAEVSVIREGKILARAFVETGKELTLKLPVEIAGQNLFELRVAQLNKSLGDELSLANNSALISVNGVRERLNVLLVSGQPHQGERAWRNLLKSDPSVDLIHFTILRPADKRDKTPINELSLIAFPVRELFQEKLNDFDLIIFDQYPRRGILPGRYFGNIADYVDQGGALFVSSGPKFATTQTIYATALERVIPGRPDGIVVEQKFKPQVSDLGRRHPISANLLPIATDENADVEPKWGSWMRQIQVNAERGQVLMTGVGDKPLLIADRIGEGRVVQLASDNLWLWSRGFEGGGPDTELLRRSAHWLMGEPELEEEQLRATVTKGRMQIVRRSLGVGDVDVEITTPSGKKLKLTLVDQPNGLAVGELEVDEQGIYELRADKLETQIAVGTLNPRELADLRSTTEVLAPFVEARGGFNGRGVPLAKALTLPDLKTISVGRKASGASWMGVVNHKATRLLGLKSLSLTPAILALLLILGLLLWAWWRESE